MTACVHLLLQLLLELGEPGIWAQHWNFLSTRISANLILVNEAGLQSQGCTRGTMGDRLQSSGCALRCPWGSCAPFRAPCPVGNLCLARSEGNPREKLLFQQVENISFAFLPGNEPPANPSMAPTSTRGTPKMSNLPTFGSITRGWSSNPLINPQIPIPS